ncbi:MAG: arachidonate 15-lipoxygenase [Gammaproteobacteria bacterium]|nr:arachidonate 15-lipoxygenase [Gammaproteobacteria bacterium]
MSDIKSIPTLPQHDSPEQQQTREFQLSLAHTEYNYMTSYMEGVPLSADLPEQEKFSTAYEIKLLPVFKSMASNLISVTERLFKKQIEDDLSFKRMDELKHAIEELGEGINIAHLGDDVKAIKSIFNIIGDLPKAFENISHLPKDLAKALSGLKKLAEDTSQKGATEILKNTLFDILSTEAGRDYLQAENIQDYEDLFETIALPQMLTIPAKPWMKGDEKPCMQDWFFGYLQVGGFNTTNLRAIKTSAPAGTEIVELATLLQKMPLTDGILQQETGDSNITLQQAADQGRLFVTDYACLDGARTTPVHGEQRYLAAPIAVFYFNPNSPEGYPPSEHGVMQPIAIQLQQSYDEINAPIFTPTDAANADDENGFKWRIAKYFVNVSCAIQHESIAHLGDCHLTLDPIVVATNRKLSTNHPLMVLLKPHFRFTININNSALHSLIIPGGVVATNVGPKIEDTWELVRQAHLAWQFDDNSPDKIFDIRGVADLPEFPFRDDTVLLWQATKNWVSDYIDLYYPSNQEVFNDYELQAWVNELVSPNYAKVGGMRGLTPTGDSKHPFKIDNKDYLKKIISQIIYIAGPQHASVNYAQYPLMSYMPSVAGTIYQPAPTKQTEINSENDCIAWYPPLDVSMYTFLFEYLLSGVQYDTFGHYSEDPKIPYFTDRRLAQPLAEFQEALADIEVTIRKRNKNRPMEYPFQLPSQIPNSISI